MKYAVGYFDLDEFERPFTHTLQEFSEHISEVYFPWPTLATCRTGIKGRPARERLEESLYYAVECGIRLNLVCNANCYGRQAISLKLQETLFQAIGEIIEYIGPLYAVTTTSPAIAYLVKQHFPEIQVRASVNMRLGKPEAALPLFDYFDAFYLPREFNYDFEGIRQWKQVLGERPLYLLVNSGCMPYCPGQIFHDNLVAHEEEIAQTRNIEGFLPYVCWSYYGKNPYLLLNGTWIRPEDLVYYEKDFSVVKLATRIHDRPYSVVKAYANGRFRGNILNLLEPDHTALLQGGMLDNTCFPEDWFTMKKEGRINPEELYERIICKP